MNEYFSHEELRCKCCGRAAIDREFLTKLTALRVELGFPFPVTSGFRCFEYNTKIGGAPNSAHLKGKAVDIAVAGNQAAELVKWALARGFTGIGVKQHGEGRFILLDTAYDVLTLWSYR